MAALAVWFFIRGSSKRALLAGRLALETQQWPMGWLTVVEADDALWPASSITVAAPQKPAAAKAMPRE